MHSHQHNILNNTVIHRQKERKGVTEAAGSRWDLSPSLAQIQHLHICNS